MDSAEPGHVIQAFYSFGAPGGVILNALANFFLISVHSKFAIILWRVYACLCYPVVQINILGYPKIQWVPSALNVGPNPVRLT